MARGYEGQFGHILNAPYVFTQGPIVQEKYTNGVKFTIGLTLTQ